MGFCYLEEVRRDLFQANMIEDQERCLKCGGKEKLQGVAVTIGRRTFHLFYLCAKCESINLEELQRLIARYKSKGKQ